MRAKAIKDLAQLPDRLMFEQIAIGLSMVRENMDRLHDDAELLSQQGRPQGYQILSTYAEEESAKYLILLDAVRCPRSPSDQLARQLWRFVDHVPKGLYAQAIHARPVDLDELQRYLDLLRREYFLDGSEGVEWIYRNDIIALREQAIYVDYVDTDEGHKWWPPRPVATVIEGVHRPAPLNVRLVQAFEEVGIESPHALKIVADQWRPWVFQQDTHAGEYHAKAVETVTAILAHSGRAAPEAERLIAELWPFPMWSLDLSLLPVKQEELREVQRSWTPAW